jgi:hypothetical protein
MFLTFDAQGQSGGFTVLRGNSQHVFPTSYGYASHSMAHSIMGAVDVQPCGRNKGSYRALLGIGSSRGRQAFQRGWAVLSAPVRPNRVGSPVYKFDWHRSAEFRAASKAGICLRMNGIRKCATSPNSLPKCQPRGICRMAHAGVALTRMDLTFIIGIHSEILASKCFGDASLEADYSERGESRTCLKLLELTLEPPTP